MIERSTTTTTTTTTTHSSPTTTAERSARLGPDHIDLDVRSNASVLSLTERGPSVA